MVGHYAIDALRRSGYATDEVSSPDDDRHLDAQLVHVVHFLGDAMDGLRVNAKTAGAEQRFPAQLQQDASKYRISH